jgi:hypothetical protein
MNFVKAMQCLQGGNMIRRKNWAEDYYWMLNTANGRIRDNHRDIQEIELSHFYLDEDDWELFQLRKKKKQQVYQWRAREQGREWFVYEPLMDAERASFVFNKKQYEIHAGPFEVEV